MRSDRQAGGAAGTQAKPARSGVGSRPSWCGRMAGIALLASTFLLAAPAQAAPGDGSGLTSAAPPTDLVGVPKDHDATVVTDERARTRLPFARLDIAILVLGGGVVTVAAASAPLLLRPRRLIPPVFAMADTASEPPRRLVEQGAPAHVPA